MLNHVTMMRQVSALVLYKWTEAMFLRAKFNLISPAAATAGDLWPLEVTKLNPSGVASFACFIPPHCSQDDGLSHSCEGAEEQQQQGRGI